MQVFMNILKFFPYVLSGVVAVENVIGATASGADKKQVILDSILAAAKVGEKVPTEVVQQVSGLIDAVVGALNSSGIFGHKPTGAPTV